MEALIQVLHVVFSSASASSQGTIRDLPIAVRQVRKNNSRAGSNNILGHRNHPKQSSVSACLNRFCSSPGRRCYSRIEYLSRHHSNLDRHLRMVLRHTVVLDTGPLLEIHRLFVVPSGHISRHSRRNGQPGTGGWNCDALDGGGRTEARRCLTELEMVVVA